MNRTQIQEKFEAIRKRATEYGLVISRIPPQARNRFKELAKDEFEGDYGMTLKWLLDFRDGILIDPNEKLTQQVEVLVDEIAELKGQFGALEAQKEQENTIRMANGRIVHKG